MTNTLYEQATEHAGRADDCGQLARAVLEHLAKQPSREALEALRDELREKQAYEALGMRVRAAYQDAADKLSALLTADAKPEPQAEWCAWGVETGTDKQPTPRPVRPDSAGQDEQSGITDLERRLREEVEEICNQWPETADLLLEAADALATWEKTAAMVTVEAEKDVNRIADLEEQLAAQRARIAELEHARAGLDHQWHLQMDRAEAAEAELARLGHGSEPIFVFGDDGLPKFTSYVGDASWDTRQNRERTFRFIKSAEAKIARVVAALAEWEKSGHIVTCAAVRIALADKPEASGAG